MDDDNNERHIRNERHAVTLEPAKRPEREIFGLGSVKNLHLEAFHQGVTLATFKSFGAFFTANPGKLCFQNEPAYAAKLFGMKQ